MWLERAKIEYQGDRIQSLKMELGREARPLFDTLQRFPPRVAVKWADRFSAVEAIAAEWSVARVFETLQGLKVPERAEYLRALYSELNRMFWVTDYLVRIFQALGDSTLVQQGIRLRELMLESQDAVSGSRILPQILTVGGVDRDLTAGEARKVKSLIRTMEFELRIFFRYLSRDFFLVSRLRGLLPISREKAIGYSFGGSFGQASGVRSDMRINAPYGPYAKLKLEFFNPATTQDWFSELPGAVSIGDGFQRLRSVFFQLRQSIGLVDEILQSIPEGSVKAEESTTGSEDRAVYEAVEGGSGPLWTLHRDGEIRIYSHSRKIAPFMEHLATGLHVEDLEAAFASIGIDPAQVDAC